jgi:hypothetical protein
MRRRITVASAAACSTSAAGATASSRPRPRSPPIQEWQATAGRGTAGQFDLHDIRAQVGERAAREQATLVSQIEHALKAE